MTAVTVPVSFPSSRRWPWFGAVTFAFLVVSQAMAIASSPADRDMGDLQKIMYVHVPSAWATMLSFFIVLAFSLRYLWQRRESDDLVAAAAAEVGATFNGLTLVLGMLWGRPTWGVWWTWDARLTSTLVLFLIFVGYLSLRAFIDEPGRRAQWSAAVGILGAINVPIVYLSVKWWRTLHQPQSTMSTLDPVYVMWLHINATAFVLLMVYFIRQRYVAARIERAAELAAQAAALGGR